MIKASHYTTIFKGFALTMWAFWAPTVSGLRLHSEAIGYSSAGENYAELSHSSFEPKASDMPGFKKNGELEQIFADYSPKLYGAPDVLDLIKPRILWSHLLPNNISKYLHIECDENSSGSLSYYVSRQLGMIHPSAIWVHRPENEWPYDESNGAIPDNEDVEITHCASTDKDTSKLTKMWFHHMPGSGVYLNVGKSLRLEPYMTYTNRKNPPTVRLHQYLTKGDFENAGKLGFNLSEYDSVQFPRFRAFIASSNPRGETITEIVMLKWCCEDGTIAQLQPEHRAEIKCGHPERLQTCSDKENAFLQQSHDHNLGKVSSKWRPNIGDCGRS